MDYKVTLFQGSRHGSIFGKKLFILCSLFACLIIQLIWFKRNMILLFYYYSVNYINLTIFLVHNVSLMPISCIAKVEMTLNVGVCVCVCANVCTSARSCVSVCVNVYFCMCLFAYLDVCGVGDFGNVGVWLFLWSVWMVG